MTTPIERTRDAGALSFANESPLLTRQEAADFLRITTRTLDELRKRSEIDATTIARRVLYRRETLDRYIERQTEGDCQ